MIGKSIPLTRHRSASPESVRGQLFLDLRVGDVRAVPCDEKVHGGRGGNGNVQGVRGGSGRESALVKKVSG
jgi:hypothetical protein